jgi:Ca2+-transporting ATPase
VLERLRSTASGLTEREAAARLRATGPNALAAGPSESIVRLVLEQLKSVVVGLLIVAGGVALLSGDLLDAAAIGVVLVLNTAIGFATEYRARRAIASLLALEVPKTTVVRGGARREVSARELVPGDVVELDAGQRVPADARLLSSADLTTIEAPLTGESLPVEKAAAAEPPGDAPLADRPTMVYAATAVATGHGVAVVTATGMRTEVGRIGALTTAVRRRRTPLEARLDRLGRNLAIAALAIAAVVAVLGALQGIGLAQSIELGIAIAVAAVPEGLPAVATIAMAVGVRRMARRAAVVRHLPAVESLGAATVVCTDKTGTLTTGQPTVVELWLDGRTVTATGVGYAADGALHHDEHPVTADDDPVLREALRIAALANRSEVTHQGAVASAVGDPTEAALLVAARKGGVDRARLLDALPEIAEVPFSAERRLMATFHRSGTAVLAYVKGAPSVIVALSEAYLTREGPRPLDAAGRERLLACNEALAGRGLRVLALATRSVDAPAPAALRGLTFVGFAGMMDPPAPGVEPAIAQFQSAGIRTVMITGDQRATAEAVSRELDLLGPDDEVLEHQELEAMSDEALAARLPRVAAFSRVSPDGKLRIVQAYQRRGDVVAMLGDGVNDAAALRQADVGVCMGGRGTDVAREAADVVLQDDRFQTIAVAIEEGRIIFDNLRKFVFYLFSCNLAEIFVVVGAALARLPAPLVPLQILWLNLLTDTFPALALALEPAEADVMRRPPQDPRTAILPPRMAWNALGYAALIAGATLGAFVWGLRAGSPARASTMAFMTLAAAQVFHLGNARSSRHVLAPSRVVRNRYALAAVVLALALQVLTAVNPLLARTLSVERLDAAAWGVVLVGSLVAAVVGQLAKLLLQPSPSATASRGR